MSVAPAELVSAAREGSLFDSGTSVAPTNPVSVRQPRTAPGPGGGRMDWEPDRVSQPSAEVISKWEKDVGTVAALAAGSDPAEKEQVWDIGQDNTPEDVVV